MGALQKIVSDQIAATPRSQMNQQNNFDQAAENTDQFI